MSSNSKRKTSRLVMNFLFCYNETIGGVMVNILIAEDNEDLCNLIADELVREGYNVFKTYDGEQALRKYEENHVDLIISDIMMPNVDGYALISSVREKNKIIPILIISAKSSQVDKYKGFNVGTDDYMVKPIDIDEVILRVKALLRRSKINSEKCLQVGGALLEYDTYTITIDGEKVTLPQKEFLILYKLLSYPDKIFTRIQLMDEFWGVNSDTNDITVYTHIHRLRDRFYNCPYFEIVTLRNIGYKAVLKQ